MKEKVREVREAKASGKLPKRLDDMKLLGVHDGKVYIASEIKEEDGLGSDVAVYTYSFEDDKIDEYTRINGIAYPESWQQQGSTLFIGSRYGDVINFDMNKMKVRKKKRFHNGIDTIVVDGSIYFGVNGDGCYKTTRGFSRPVQRRAEDDEKQQVVSAMTIFDDKVFTFYFSNGNDPFLDGKPAGGFVQVLDKKMNLIDSGHTPYAVDHAVSDKKRIYFATRNTSNGWDRFGSGELYSLSPKNLKYKEIEDLPSAVTSLRLNGDYFLIGLKDGQLIERDKKGRSRTLYEQEHSVKGIGLADGKVYCAGGGEVAV